MDPITIAMGLAQFVPWIVGLIAGPKAEDAAGKIVEAARQVTGKPTGDEALAALKADPALVLQYQQAMGAQRGDLEKAYLADRQDARRTMAQLAGVGSALSWGAAIVSTLIILCTGGVAYMVFFKPLPKEQGDLAYLLVGQVLAMAQSVVAFWLGSSMSSVQKTELLKR